MMAPERPGPEDEPGVAMVQRGGVTIPVIPVFPLANPLVQLKEGDGASNVIKVEKPSSEDDDLTSLTWLQDKNLLKGMNLRAAVCEAQESPTSDFVEDSASELADSTSSSGHSSSPAPSAPTPSKHKHPQHMPYDPLVHINSKPPYSFSCLIFMAIEDSPHRALPVKEIYAWILEHFPYFKNAPTGWKNSVRHNLSLNKCFRKVEKAPNLGKGSLWMVDPLYRPNLLQALQKAPFHPYTTLERVSMVTNRVQVNNSPSNSVNRNDFVVVKSNTRLPNPELFPFLSRRLAASGVEGMRTHEATRADSDTTTDDADSLDDGDAEAATAMLALKHGPRILSPRRIDWFRRTDNEDKALDMRNSRKKLRASKQTQDLPSGQMIPVITTSPSEDHTYSAGLTPTQVPPTTSPDEAYEEGSDSDDDIKPLVINGVAIKSELQSRSSKSCSTPSDAEEQRKIAEGADALLNLAGITTRKRSHSGTSDYVSGTPVSSDSGVPVLKRSSLRGRRKGGGTGFRPRLLRSVRPSKKIHNNVELPRQRVTHRRKSQTSISINNNNIIITGHNNQKITKAIKPIHHNTNENEWVRQPKSEEKIGRTKR